MARKQAIIQIIRQEQDGLIELLQKELTVAQYKLLSELMDDFNIKRGLKKNGFILMV
jgi:hypothetical protein